VLELDGKDSYVELDRFNSRTTLVCKSVSVFGNNASVQRTLRAQTVGLNIRKPKNWEILADSERTQIEERAGHYLICEPF